MGSGYVFVMPVFPGKLKFVHCCALYNRDLSEERVRLR